MSRMRLPPPLKCSAAELDQETKVPTTSSSSAEWTQKLKLTGSEAFCPIGGFPCGDILNSVYAFASGYYLQAMCLKECLWLGWWRMAWLWRLVCNWPQRRCCLLGLTSLMPSSWMLLEKLLKNL
nr:thiol-disulfide oxidoreductase LTO1-like isoform X2 [Arachis hypogaea]